jgi:hypothetical protein
VTQVMWYKAQVQRREANYSEASIFPALLGARLVSRRPHQQNYGANCPLRGLQQPMITVTQTTRLLAWVILGLIVLGILLYLFGPAALRTDELIVIGLLIIGLIWFQVWLRRRAR